MTDTDYEGWFETGSDAPVGLSEAGATRRRAMQVELQAAVVSRRRRRTAVRWSASALAAAVLAAVLWRDPEVGRGQAPQERSLAMQNSEYGVVRDDAAALERCRVRSAPVPAEVWVNDDQLVELLAAANRPTGLIRTPGRVMLTHDVVDTIGE